MDGTTGVPIRVEFSGLPGLKKGYQTDFRLNEELPDSLFSLEVPDGYQVNKMEMDESNLSEQDLINGLKWMAERNGGVFPESTNMPAPEPRTKPAEPTSRSAGTSEPASQPPRMTEEAIQSTLRYVRMLGFIQHATENWSYTGKGVKVGDVSAVVARWQPRGSQTYRAMYGDFSIKDALPPKEATSQAEPGQPK